MHYQIIFKEQGVTINLVPNLCDVMKALTAISMALQLLGKLCWCMCIGMLALAIYCGITEVGTMHFMSVKPLRLQTLRGAEDNTKSLQKNWHVPFVHIHLHDVESLWWVAVWVVFYNNFWAPQQSDTSPDLKTIQHQPDQAMILFPSVMESTHRQNGFQSHFPSIREALAGGLPNKSSIYTDLDFPREVLVDHYTSVKAMLPHSINLSASKEQIYEDFRAIFMSFQESAFTLAFIPDLKRELLGMLKRPRPETASEIGVAARKRRLSLQLQEIVIR
ncbi:hypothetical protein BS47DRAFT_1383904 [Hydnum rufescens UP504]|uniref:Uncharacterized protein n=1 Tax=Hydnum rufescens UP504 TaxID=1448309 RepID=A0A9P6AR84_9AGAM|nr:hypothetical protein BS47DRAFT_1383904 [Hydnum rufescens UP504]